VGRGTGREPNLPRNPEAREARRSYLDEQYPLWVRINRLRASNVRRMREELPGFVRVPTFGLLLPASEAAPLERTLGSVLAQVYPHWELRVLPRDASVERFFEQEERPDGRVKLLPASPGDAQGDAPEGAAGEFVGFLREGDELAPEALFEVAKLLQERPDADLVYSDEDELDEAGVRSNPNFKPGWSPELLLCADYVSRLGLFRRSLLEEVGAFDGPHDLALRFAEKTASVFHVPKVLYHSRVGDRADEREASLRAIRGALERRSVGGRVEEGPLPGVFSFRPSVEGKPKVSVLIPTRDNPALLRNCIESVESLSTYGNYEILVVDNGSEEAETLAYLSSLPHRVLRFDEPFNYSKINNFAAAHAEGEYLLLLNDDTEVISAGWIEAMLGHAQDEEVGAVGAKLLYPDGLVQHAGVVLGTGNFWAPGVAAHALQHYPADSTGRVGEVLETTRNYGAVTAACMMLRRSVFDEVGGFDEALTVAFNDVDLCLKIRRKGYRVVYTPHAELYHYESASRGPQRRPKENLLVRERWSGELDGDPYYNPNFSLGAGDFNLRADALRPRSLREEPVADGPHLEEMERELREAFLTAERARARSSRRTSVVGKKEVRLAAIAPPRGDAVSPGGARGVPTRAATGPVREEQIVWMFGSPRTGSTWISGVMAELKGGQRWNEPHVGLLFGSFFYEKMGPDNPLMDSPAFILGSPYRKAWLNSIKNFVLEGAAVRFPKLESDGYVVVKEPNGSVGAPLMMEAMPQSRLVFLLRDPRDVISSWLDAFGAGSWNATDRDYETTEKLNAQTRRLAERYLKVVSQVQHAYEAHAGRKALVRYEDLRRDAFGVLSSAYDALGIEADRAELETAVAKHAWENIPEEKKGAGKFYRKGTPGGWREDLSPEQVEIVEGVTAPVLSRYY
jgi:GT2 family glycosyltransferase